jgi:Tfp pilus assembly protein PilV
MRRASRGFSLVEVMVASLVLIIGLTGLTAMLMRGAVNGRNADQLMISAELTNQIIQDLESAKFDSLTPNVGLSFDAGTALDAGYFTDTSGRSYQGSFYVSDITAVTSNPNPTYRIDIQMLYRDGNGQPAIRRATTVLSKAPVNAP